MRKTRLLLVVCILLFAVLPAAADAQVATPSPAFGIADAISPADLHDRLSTTPFPDDLLPPEVATLEP